jgi:Peptidase family S41
MATTKTAAPRKKSAASTRSFKKSKKATPHKSAPKTKANPTAKAEMAPETNISPNHSAAAIAVMKNIGDTQSVPEFLKTAGELTKVERELLIDQALAMIDNVYTHLLLKNAMHAINPAQQLRLLKQRHVPLSERAFHDAMISIYVHLRDLHTNYVLPSPYNSRTAIVPFKLQEFMENGERDYIVTQVSPIVTDPNFVTGVIVTHWNNIPIDRAVEVNAEREAGSNLSARHAQGLASLTKRWMGMSLPPDEEKVNIRYLDLKNKPREITLDWVIFVPGAAASGIDLLSASGPLASVLGVDMKSEMERRVLKLLFDPQSIVLEKQMGDYQAGTLGPQAMIAAISVSDNQSMMPDAFPSFRTVETPDGKFGYIRIRTFNVQSADQFVSEFIRLAALLPENGLIIDIRGNGGGLIWAAERLLQVLTPRTIQPANFHFINSPITLKMSGQNADIGEWKDSIQESIQTGAPMSQGFPLTSVDSCNNIGQQYWGPVVLVTDALVYSAADMFAAGFQDHEIGTILGVDTNTGAGGANVWTHSWLLQNLPGPDSPFQQPPKDATFRVAIRQTTRVGAHSGVLIEDLGVIPDQIHTMTKDDVLKGNVDLMNAAGHLLANMPVYTLKAKLLKGAGTNVQVTATTKNLTRLDVFLNQRPQLSLDVTDGDSNFNFQSAAGPGMLELRGYKNDQLAISRRIAF